MSLFAFDRPPVLQMGLKDCNFGLDQGKLGLPGDTDRRFTSRHGSIYLMNWMVRELKTVCSSPGPCSALSVPSYYVHLAT